MAHDRLADRAMIDLEFDRIPPGAEIDPRGRDLETVIYLAAGEIVAEPVDGPGPGGPVVIRAGDVIYEAPTRTHRLRNERRTDALALRAALTRPPAGHVAGRPGSIEASVRRREQARTVERPGVRQRVLVQQGDFGSAGFKISEIVLAPGATTGWHRHQRSEHVAVVLEGRGTVRMGSLEETLEPLRGVRVEMGLPHAISNTGRTALRYYLCATPAPDPLSDREDLDPET